MMHDPQFALRVVLGVVLAIMGQACHSPEPSSPAATSLPGTYTFPSCDVAPEGKYGAGPARSLYLRMRDGVRIAVDVVLPEDLPEGRRIPAILIMTRRLSSMFRAYCLLAQPGFPPFDGAIGR
jgi:hypothetical protein